MCLFKEGAGQKVLEHNALGVEPMNVEELMIDGIDGQWFMAMAMFTYIDKTEAFVNS